MDKFKGRIGVTQENIEFEMRRSLDYAKASDQEIEKNAKQIYEKLQILNQEFVT